PAPGLRVGVAVVDASWRVGAGSGQYAEKEPGALGLVTDGPVDPFHHSTVQRPSYGVQSRLDYRALVVEGADGQRVALVKSDSYLAQDLLTRRAAQLLAAGDSGIGYEQLVLMASHNHSSPYRTTPTVGLWVFQDVMDLRAFEYHARQMAAAVDQAAANLRPARMGATVVQHRIYKGNIARPSLADDGTPSGYPDDHADFGLSIVRFDDVSGPTPQPLAVFVNHGQHPESNDAYDLISEDYLAPLQRMVGRDLGATLVFSQGDVGSSEGPYLREDPEVLPDGVVRAWAHVGHAQTERGARYLADSVIEGWEAIGRGDGLVPFSRDVPVRALTAMVPGPLSHPYPSISNCRTESTIEGDPGVPVLGQPDCERLGETVPSPLTWDDLKDLGLPVPEHYDAPSVGVVEENARLKLQVVRLGEVVLASCACEPQMDLVRNLESRIDDVAGNIDNGFDWSSRCAATSAETWTCAFADGSLQVPADRIERMRAQVNNDAADWDDPANLVSANAEPADPAAIKGNFTHTELPARLGYRLPIALGHASDYNGYTVSYREYLARDHYRKAMTSYGPHTADHMNTALMALAGSLKGGPPLAASILDPVAVADEARHAALAEAIGRASSAALDTWNAALPADVGPAVALAQPQDITRFAAATFSWRGGSTALDNPTVRVERKVGERWRTYADQSGEVPTMVALPVGATGTLDAWTGTHEWRWTAAFEAFDAFPTRAVNMGQVPVGTYRFVVKGLTRTGGADRPYRLTSEPFRVSRWTGLTAGDGRAEPDGSITFTATARYPRSYASPFPYVHDDGSNVLCRTCSFRPWASGAEITSAVVTVTGPRGTRLVEAVRSGDRWSAPTYLAKGETAVLAPGALVDAFGETNGSTLTLLLQNEDSPCSSTALCSEPPWQVLSAGSSSSGPPGRGSSRLPATT
ncbi:MAG: hypothetical protein ACRDZU_00500, partial [Acidimicrobiales bacterium]